MNQRTIYDQRYAGVGYDERSAVPVLTAETSVLHRTTRRALETVSDDGPVTLLDFASGTGRVTNDFAKAFPTAYGSLKRGLCVVAYDVSSIGLEKAARTLVKDFDFDVVEELHFDRTSTAGRLCGSVRRISEGITVTVTFVHGNEEDDSIMVGKLLTEANGGRPYAITTSWYSGLSHIPTAARRGSFFTMLSDVTDVRGELLVAASVSGDLVELQAEWEERLLRGDVGDWPIEKPGDVVYETELRQSNYYHVFGTDLTELLETHRAPGQTAWLEAVRLPDPEFRSRAEELANYRRVQDFNAQIRHRAWRPEDYRRVHTAAAIRSGHRRAAVAR